MQLKKYKIPSSVEFFDGKILTISFFSPLLLRLERLIRDQFISKSDHMKISTDLSFPIMQLNLK